MKPLQAVLFFCFTFFLVVLIANCGRQMYPSESRPISHEHWDSLLREYVSSDGLVDYRGFKKDSLRFGAYLEQLRTHHPNPKNWSEEEQLAYWINAYNAFTIELVLKHYPVKSIKDIRRGIPFINSVWDISFIEIEDAEYDLNNIEHGILRKHFSEPRIHFAIVCASASCPPLRPEAYTPAKLEQQLNEQARIFINDPARNRLSPQRIEISKIFYWFKGDFTEVGSLIDYLNRYAEVEIAKDAKKDFLDYDWSLNESI